MSQQWLVVLVKRGRCLSSNTCRCSSPIALVSLSFSVLPLPSSVHHSLGFAMRQDVPDKPSLRDESKGG